MSIAISYYLKGKIVRVTVGSAEPRDKRTWKIHVRFLFLFAKPAGEQSTFFSNILIPYIGISSDIISKHCNAFLGMKIDNLYTILF